LDCAIAIFGGGGILSFFLFTLFIVSFSLLIVLHHSMRESRDELNKLRERLERLEGES
jgi:hypothetical protein